MINNITITIDDKPVQAMEGETILQAALRHGIKIPNLCHFRKVSHTASCRLCMVFVEGREGPIPSCTIPVEEGMIITAFNDELHKMRRTILDLALSNHNDDCISCVQDGDCELQDLAFQYNLGKDDRTFPPVWQELDKSSDTSSQVLNYHASKCIQCNRCIKACYEIQGKGILTFANRGIRTTVSTGFEHWSDSLCDGCGECIQTCPVGALTPKQFYGEVERIRKKDIERTTVTTCPYCGVGCQLAVSSRKQYGAGPSFQDAIIHVSGANEIPNHGKLCVKGRFGLDYTSHAQRLTKPLIRKDGTFVEVSWFDAIAHTAKQLAAIKEKHGPDALGGLSSATCTNEDNYLFQKFMRSVIGTNNVDHCARLCHASTVAGLATTLGSGAMTNSIEELEHANVILVTGSNTTESHPVIATHIKRAVLFNGAKLIVVDPREIDLVRFASVWLRQRNGTDIAWLNGFLHVILQHNLQDDAFIEQHTEHVDELKKVVEKYTPEKVEEITGIPAKDLTQAAKLFGSAEKASIIYAMGITQHAHGTSNVKSIANLALLTGNLGRESTGVNPLRGQNNVQGACDLGALPNVYPGYQKVNDPAAQQKFESAWNATLSGNIGLTLVEMMNAASHKKLKGMYIMGENPMVSDPNLDHVKSALKKLDFLVVQDIFLTETAELADVVLPACSFVERDGTFTNTERRVLPVRAILEKIGESREDWLITQELAQAMGHSWNYGSVKDILDEINTLTPQYGGITSERITAGELLQWPCPSTDHPGTKYLYEDGFPLGKALFTPLEHEEPRERPDKKYPFVLSTGRILCHYHTGSMTRRTKALPKYVKDPYVEMCGADIEQLNLVDGEMVRISSRRGSIDIAVKQTERVQPGSIFIPFHFAEAPANKLTIDELDPIAKIPELKVCAVKIEKL